MVSTREHLEMGWIPVSPSGLESAYLECIAAPSISRPNGHARQVKVMASVKFRKFNRFETQH
jgi:hypothetical protein